MTSAAYSDKSTSKLENLVDQMDLALRLGMEQLVDQFRLNPDLLARYEENIRHSLVSLTSGTEKRAEKSAQDQPWGWSPAIESPDLSVGTLTIFDSRDIPLHDHPGSTGLLLVLQGEVQISQYRILDARNAREISPLELEQTGVEHLASGETSLFGPEQNNIHTLHAVEGDCILLDVLFNPYQLQQRSFYLPVTQQSNEKTLYVSRLNKLRSGPIH